MYQNIYISNKTDEEDALVYVWGDGKHNDAGLKIYPWSDFNYAFKLDDVGDKETIFGDRATKTFFWNKNQHNIFEKDIPREVRVLTDLYLQSDEVSVNHSILYLDIETSSEGGFADTERADKKITAIGCSINDEEIVFLLDEGKKLFPREKINDTEIILAFDTEEDLLQAFLKYYTDQKPTIITGWNIDIFDIPYLYRRIKLVLSNDDANLLSPIGHIHYNGMREKYQIAGVNCLDYLRMYKKFTYTIKPSYRLHDIGLAEVKMGKVLYEGSLDDLYEQDIHEFIKYNLQDVRIVKEIDKKHKMIDLVLNISHIGHTKYEDFLYPSKYIEGTIITYLHRQGKIVPNNREEGRAELEEKLQEDEEGFEGAYVKPPSPGLYNYVFNLDLQSLYPSIIMSLNISPESKMGKIINWNIEDYIKKTQDKYIVKINDVEDVLSRERLTLFIQSEKLMVSSNGVLYRSDKLGIIPEILDNWFNERIKFKDLMKKYVNEHNEELSSYYDRRQHVQKILLNSIYGVLGLPIFRFYDIDNAEAVTLTGQDVIKTTSKMLNIEFNKKTGIEKDHCIYIDTDSVYFSSQDLIKDKDPKQFTITLARELEEKTNNFYDVMANRMFFCNNHRFHIKGESISETALWIAKKRYAMLKIYDLEKNIDIDRKLKVTGLDVVRSSFPAAFQKIMSNILISILKQENKDVIDNMILSFRGEMDSLPFKDVAKNTSVQKIKEYDNKKEKGFKNFEKGCPAHVKASISYNRWLRINKLDNIYEPIRNGDKIKWAYLKNNPLGVPTMALKGFNDPQDLIDFVSKYVNYDALFESELKKKVQAFYDALSWGMIPTEVNQTVNKFFSF